MLSEKRSSERIRDILQNTEGSVNAALAVFRDTIENVKKITGNVNAVSEDVRQICSTCQDWGRLYTV